MPDEFAVVDPADVEPERFRTCDVSHRKLTEPAGCTEMRVNLVRLEPGDVTTPHRHESHEEVYVALTGGTVEIDGERHAVAERGVVRIGPGPLRSVRNDTDDETHRWYMFGAPPVGTVDDFGGTVLPDGERLSARDDNA